MTLLALHTTDAQGSIAIATAGRTIAIEFAAHGTHAPSLWSQIERAFATAGLGLEACSALAVTVGPGSFTGIRIGIATAQGLAAARGLPLYPCGSLTAHAAAFHGRAEGPHAVVLDARRGEVFGGLYDVREIVPRPIVPPFCLPPGAAAEALAAAGVASVSGSGAALLGPAFGVRRAPAPEPVAAALARLVHEGGARPVPPRDLEPDYLRKSDAEQKRDRTR